MKDKEREEASTVVEVDEHNPIELDNDEECSGNEGMGERGEPEVGEGGKGNAISVSEGDTDEVVAMHVSDAQPRARTTS